MLGPTASGQRPRTDIEPPPTQTDRIPPLFGGPRDLARIAWALTVAAIGIGTFARLYALGFSPLAVDEYYFLVSIQSILATGIPEPPGGGYYVRGLPVQYLTAASIFLFGGPEFGLRFPMVLLGLGSALVAYFWGRRVHSRELGVALAVALLVSSWSIEFSRFGRMYAGFQFLTLLFLLALDKVVAGDAGIRGRFVPHALLVLAVPTHALSMLLVPLLALPAVLPGAARRLGGRRQAVAYLGVTVLVFAGLFAYYNFPFRAIGVVDRLPPATDIGVELAARPSLLLLPAFPFWSISSSNLVNFVGVTVALGLAGVALELVRLRGHTPSPPLRLAAMAIVAAVFHQLLLASVLGGVAVARYRIYRQWRAFRHTWRLLGIATMVSLGWLIYAAWLTYGAGSREWLEHVGVELFRSGIYLTFFGWPQVLEPIVRPWSEEMPRLGAVLLIGLGYQIVTSLKHPLADMVRNPAFIVLYIIVLFGTLASIYQSTRYTYFIYPIALAAVFMTVRDLIRFVARRASVGWLGAREGAWAVVVFLAVFALTEDFNPRHLARTGSPEAVYRTGPFRAMERTWYPRSDYRAAGRFVSGRASLAANIVVIDLPPVSHYVERSHAVYLPRDGDRFRNVSRERGTIDYWSGLRLLSTPGELGSHTQEATEVWLIRRADWGHLVVDLSEAFAGRQHVIRREYLSIDGRLEVLHVDLGPVEKQADEAPA